MPDQVSLGLLMDIKAQGAEIVQQITDALVTLTSTFGESSAAAATSSAAVDASAAAEAAGVTAADADIQASNAATSASTDEMTKAFGSGGLAIVAAVGVAAVAMAKLSIDWQDTMTSLENATGQPRDAVLKIGDAMGHLSEKVTFDETTLSDALAGSAAQWQQYTGKTLDAKSATDLMGTSAQLAMVSHGDLNNTTKDLVNTMIAYQVPASEAASVSDTLYNTSLLTGSSVDDLSRAMDRLRGRLGEASPSLNDVATLTDSLAAHGTTGSRGIITVATAFSTLLGGSKPVTKELEKLGVSIFDSSGKFIGMKATIQELGPALGKLSEQQQDAAVKALFGASAGGIMMNVLKDGIPVWNQHSVAVGQAGTVAKNYGHMQDDLSTKVTEFKNHLEELGRIWGDVLAAKVNKLIDTVAPYVKLVMNWLSEHKELRTLLILVAATVGITAIAFGIYTLATIAATAASTLLAAILTASFLPVVLAIVAAVIIAYEVYTHWSQITKALSGVWSAASGEMRSVWETLKSGIIAGITDLLGWLQQFSAAWTVAKDVALLVFTYYSTAFKIAWDLVHGIIKIAIDLLHGDWSKAWKDTETMFKKVWDDISGAVSKAWDLIYGILNITTGGRFGALLNDIGSAMGWLGSLFGTIFGAIGQTVKNGVNDVISAINGFISMIDRIQIHIPSVGVGPFHTPSFDWNGLGIPYIPYLAEGGIVSSPMLAMIGEAGPEAVVPLGKGGFGGGGITVNLSGNTFYAADAGTLANLVSGQVARNLRTLVRLP